MRFDSTPAALAALAVTLVPFAAPGGTARDDVVGKPPLEQGTECPRRRGAPSGEPLCDAQGLREVRLLHDALITEPWAFDGPLEPTMRLVVTEGVTLYLNRDVRFESLVLEDGAGVMAVPDDWPSPMGFVTGFVEPPISDDGSRRGHGCGPFDPATDACPCVAECTNLRSCDMGDCNIGAGCSFNAANGTPGVQPGGDGGDGMSFSVWVNLLEATSLVTVQAGRGGAGGNTSVGGKAGKGGRGGCFFMTTDKAEGFRQLTIRGGDGGNGGQAVPTHAGNGGDGGEGGQAYFAMCSDLSILDGYMPNSMFGGKGGDGGRGVVGGRGGDGACVLAQLVDMDFDGDAPGFSFLVRGGDGGAGGDGITNGGNGGNGESAGVRLSGFTGTNSQLAMEQAAGLENGAGGDGGDANQPDGEFARGGDGGDAGPMLCYGETQFVCNPPKCSGSADDLDMTVGVCWSKGGDGGNASATNSSGGAQAIGGAGGSGEGMHVNQSVPANVATVFLCGDGSGGGGGGGGSAEAYASDGGDASAFGGDGGGLRGGDGGDACAFGGDAEPAPDSKGLPGGNATIRPGRATEGGQDGTGTAQGGAGGDGRSACYRPGPGGCVSPAGGGPGGRGGDATGFIGDPPIEAFLFGGPGGGGGIVSLDPTPLEQCPRVGYPDGEPGSATFTGNGFGFPGPPGPSGISPVPNGDPCFPSPCLVDKEFLAPDLESEELAPAEAALLFAALTGPELLPADSVPPKPGAVLVFDANGDLHVDLRDLAELQVSKAVSTVPPSVGPSGVGLGPEGSPTPGSGTVTFGLQSASDGATVAAGTAIEWELLLTVSPDDNLGLALFGVDLVQAPGNPATLDLAPGFAASRPAQAFDLPDGITNPGSGGFSGFGGTHQGTPGALDLTQVGGAQNTFGVSGRLPGIAERTVPLFGVGQGPRGVVAATGTIVAPSTQGTYVFTLESPFANTLNGTGQASSVGVVRAGTVVANPSIAFTVQ